MAVVVNSKQYEDEKLKFLKRHKNRYQLYTSPMDANGQYNKIYATEDGGQWCEVMVPVVEEVEVEIHGCKICTVSAKFMRTEFWSTDNANSKYYYEKW